MHLFNGICIYILIKDDCMVSWPEYNLLEGGLLWGGQEFSRIYIKESSEFIEKIWTFPDLSDDVIFLSLDPQSLSANVHSKPDIYIHKIKRHRHICVF